MKATLHIQTGRREKKTYLKNAFCTPPFKVMDVTEDKDADMLQLILMSSSPGVLDGDAYSIKIELAEETALQLQTQAYQRLFTMRSGATQDTEVHLKKGASFCYLPHPSVPHEGSCFTARNNIHLSEDCTLIWGEVLTCGRKGSGEVFRFTKYHNITAVYRNNRLVVKENMLIEPAKTNINALGQWEGYTHQASLLFLNETLPVNDVLNEIHEWLSKQKEIVFGVTALPVNGLLVRLLGYKAEPLHEHLKSIAECLMAKTNNPTPQAQTQPTVYAY